MTRHDLTQRTLAVALAGVAGFVDACGFLATRGSFVSFMSGNSTRLGVGLTTGDAFVALGAALVAAFLAGVICVALLADRVRDEDARRAAAALGVVCLALAASAALGMAEHIFAAATVAAFAMGAMNNVFARDGDVSIGVTYMTGSLVKLGQRIAALVLGRDRTGWVPYLSLWLGFVTGVMVGAMVFPRLGFASLLAASAVTGAFALIAARARVG